MRVDIGGGTRIYFDVAGSGLVPDGRAMRAKPSFILLHGGPGFDHSLFKPWFDRFADTHQVIYVDHRGQGRSDGRDDPTGWTLDTWADDVVRFCDALDIKSPVVLGNSFGGMVALRYAARHPDHPSRIVLSSTSAGLDLDPVLEVFERLGGDEARSIADAFWHDPTLENLAEYQRVCLPLYTRHSDNLTDGEARALMNVPVMANFITEIQPTMDLTGDLALVTRPTLVLAGVDDPVCPVPHQEVIRQGLTAAEVRFELLDDCGHGTYRDQPERTEAILRDFLSP